MTKDDLKTLAQLSKVITVLRKLAGEAQELAQLAAQLNVIPSAAQAGGSVHTGEAGSRSQPALPPVPSMNGGADLATSERLEHLEEQRLIREAFLRDQRQKPDRQALLGQFAHDGNGVEE